MKILRWFRRMLAQEGASSPRASDLYEGTIQLGHDAITRPLRELAEHEQRSPEDIANEILSTGIEKYEHFDEKLAKWNALSFREQQVAALSCLGYTNHAIAEKLIISPNTVKAHVRNIQHKFNVRSKEQLRQVLDGWDFGAFDS